MGKTLDGHLNDLSRGSTGGSKANQSDTTQRMAIMLRQRMTTWAVYSCLLIGLVVAGGIGSPCAASSISYGNFGPVSPGISFIGVTESSGTDPVPLYGPPTPFVTGLDFNPTNFVATSSGGASDITDGQLNYTVMGSGSGASAVGITSISLFESGDYTLAGTGTNVTQALVGAIVQATIKQINGVDVAPFNLTPVNASVGFNLAANPGIVQPWSLGFTMNVAAQLATLGYAPSQKATKIDVVIDNQLLTFSEAGSTAFIAKKDFRINIGSGEGEIPEPTTLLLVLSGCLGMAAIAGRKSR